MADWRSEKNCEGYPVSIFYSGYPRDEQIAKAICSKCTVSKQCLDEAMKENEEFGIWGGMNPQERSNVFLRRALRGKRSAESLQNTRHEHTHLASVSLSSQLYTEDSQNQMLQVSQTVVVWKGLF